MQIPSIICFSAGELMLFFPPLILKAEAIKAISGKSLCLQNREYNKSKSLSSALLALFSYFSIFSLLFKKAKKRTNEKKRREVKEKILTQIHWQSKNKRKREGNTRRLHPDSAFMLTTRVLLTFALLRQAYPCSWLFPAQEKQV